MADGKVVIDVILDDGIVAKGVANIDKSLGGITKAGRRAATGIREIVTALGLVALGAKAINMVSSALDGAIERYDTLNNFPRVMQQIGFDAHDSEKAIQRLSDGIQGLPTTLDSVAKTTQRIAVMTGDLDGAVETTLALNNAFIASGASQEDAARGLEQYVQMLSTGTVDLEAWRTLQETMGVALNDVAKAFGFAGRSAQNDLYEALKAGNITFDEFNAKIIELSNAQGGFAERALTASGGIKTAWTNLGTAIVRGVTEIIGAIDQLLRDAGLGGIEGVIKRVGEVFFNFLSGIADFIPTVSGWLMSIKSAIDPWIPSINQVRDGFMNAFSVLQSFVMPIVQEVANFIMSVWGNLVVWWRENGEQITQAVQNAFNFILTIVQAVMPAVKFVIEIAWEAIKNIINGALTFIQGLIQIFTGIFTGDFSQLWEGIKKIFSGAIDFLIGLMSLSFLGGIRKVLMNLLKNGVKIVQNMWEGIVNFFKNFGTNAQNIASNMTSRIVNFFKNLFNRAKSIFTSLRSAGSSIWNALRNTVVNIARNIWQGVVQRFNNLLSSVRNIMSNVRSTVVNLWNRVMSFFRGINLFSIGRNIIQGLISGIGSMASAVWEKAKSIAKGIGDSIKRVLGIASPSKVMIQFGEWTGEGLEKGLNKSLKSIAKVSSKMAETIIPDGFENRLRNVSLSVGNIVPATVRVSPVVQQIKANLSNDNERNGSVTPQYAVINIGGYEARGLIQFITKEQQFERNRVNRFRG